MRLSARSADRAETFGFSLNLNLNSEKRGESYAIDNPK